MVSIEEIKENDWNLNIPRYIDTTEPEEDISVSETFESIKQLETERGKATSQLKNIIRKLGYK